MTEDQERRVIEMLEKLANAIDDILFYDWWPNYAELPDVARALIEEINQSSKFDYPWGDAEDWVEWAATDGNGDRFWYPDEPVAWKEKGFWVNNELSLSSPVEFIDDVGFRPNWEQSKQRRPQ